MTVFQQLENKYPKEFKVVFKFLSYQMMHSEALALLDLLEGRIYDASDNEYGFKWQEKFKEVLKIK